MPRKVEATLLKNKLQKAQMSYNKLHTQPYQTFSTAKYNVLYRK